MQVSVKGDTGHVGVGTGAPLARLHAASDADLTDLRPDRRLGAPDARRRQYGWGLRFSDTNEFFVASQPYGNRGDTTFGNEHLRIRADGDTGIGTALLDELDVVGGRRRLGDATSGRPAHNGSAVDLHWKTDDLYIRTMGDPAHPDSATC